MLALVERAYWTIAKKLYYSRNVNGIDFVYVEAAAGVSAQQIEATLARALDVIATARGGFGELVKSHLRLVSAIKVSHAYASHNTRAYVSPFSGHEATNSRYLACQLVWAAMSAEMKSRSPEVQAEAKRLFALPIEANKREDLLATISYLEQGLALDPSHSFYWGWLRT